MLFRYCFCALLLLSASFAQAQKLPKPKINEKDWAKMSKIEDSLVVAAAMMQLDTLTTDSTATRTLSQLALDTLSEKWRTAAAAQVLGMVRRALRTKNSFDYPFEHTRQFSILYPTNRAFRLVTWQNFVNSTTYKYYGFIQFANGKVVYLQDKKKTLRSPQNKKLKPQKKKN